MNNHFLSLLILLMSIKIKLKETWGHRKSYKCIKCSKGNRKFISKKLLKNANKGSYIKYAGGWEREAESFVWIMNYFRHMLMGHDETFFKIFLGHKIFPYVLFS